MNEAITAEQLESLKTVLVNTLDFCGNTLEAAKDFCLDNGIDFKKNQQAIESLRFDVCTNYKGAEQ